MARRPISPSMQHQNDGACVPPAGVESASRRSFALGIPAGSGGDDMIGTSAKWDYARDVLSSGVADLVVWEFTTACPTKGTERDNLTTPLKDIDFWRNSINPNSFPLGSRYGSGRSVLRPRRATPLYFPLRVDISDLTHPRWSRLGTGRNVVNLSDDLYWNADGFVDRGRPCSPRRSCRITG